MYEYEPENETRTALLAAVAKHQFAWDEFAVVDKGDVRKVSLKASRPNAEGFAHFDDLRDGLLAALHEHGYDLQVFQPQDTEGAANLTLTGKRSLAGTQMKVPGT
jgi:hypothetical protein